VKFAFRFPFPPTVPAAAAVMLAALLLALPAFSVSADLSFECDPATCVFSGPDTLDAYVLVDGTATDLRGFSLLLEYDPAIIIPVAVEPAGLLNEACFFSFFPNTASGTVAVDAAGLGCSVDGPGRIVKIRFTGVAMGVSPLRCLNSILRNSLNQEIPHTCPEGSIEYANPIPVERTSWTRLKVRY
jgi:hypothetical protein